MENSKREFAIKYIVGTIVVTIVAGVIVGILVGVCLPKIRPNIEPIYMSDVTIDPQGAKYESAMWMYDMQPEKEWWKSKTKESRAYFNMDIRNIEDDFDLSNYSGISFYIKGSKTAKVEFSLFTHVHDGYYDKYQYLQYFTVDDCWRNVNIYFSDLTRAPWTYEEMPLKLDSDLLKKTYAIGFAVRTKENRIQNTIFIDEIKLIYNNESEITTTISNFTTFNCNIHEKEGYWHAWWMIPVAVVEVEQVVNVDKDFYPSGWRGDGKYGEEYISLTRTDAFINITYKPGPERWAEIYWQYPDGNWGEKPDRNLTKLQIQRLTFWARGEMGNEIVEFKTGGIRGKKYEDSFNRSLGKIKLSQNWKQYEIVFTDKDDLSSVIGAFACKTSKDENPNGPTFYLKDIYFEKLT